MIIKSHFLFIYSITRSVRVVCRAGQNSKTSKISLIVGDDWLKTSKSYFFMWPKICEVQIHSELATNYHSKIFHIIICQTVTKAYKNENFILAFNMGKSNERMTLNFIAFGFILYFSKYSLWLYTLSLYIEKSKKEIFSYLTKESSKGIERKGTVHE